MEIAGQVVRVVGFALLLPVGFFYAASGLVAPQPWVGALWVAYLVIVVVAVGQRARPWRVLAAPAAAAALWVAVLTFGDLVLGWTA